MRVQIKPTSVRSPWLPRVEQVCADAVDQDRQEAFMSACSAAGLPAGHPVVHILASDLIHIRPPDVWLRIIASHLTHEERKTFPLTLLDHGLSSLRLADAYANRPNSDPKVTERLLAAVALQLPYPSVESWRGFRANREFGATEGVDAFEICGAAGRYAPLSMVTLVSSHFGSWATQFTSLAEQLGALDYCATEIMLWRRGKARHPKLSAQWVQNAPKREECSIIEAALNSFAESVFEGWHSTKSSVSAEWLPLLDETISASIQLAAIAVDWMDANAK